MLYEFALDPAAVANWKTREQGQLIVDAFRIGNGRVPACMPKKWKLMVWHAFDGDQGDCKRMDVLVGYLSDRASSRRAVAWDGAAAWLENAIREHARKPFRAIISTARPEGAAFVLCDDDLEPNDIRWYVARTRSVERTAAAYAQTLDGVIRASNLVLIVEPVFDPQETRFTTTLQAIAGLEPIAAGQITPCLIVRSDERTPPPEEFQRRCERYLPGRLPAGASVEVVFAEQRPGGERLHNRLIVSDVGSVLLGDSIDEGSPGETNDLALLDEDHHRAKLAAYEDLEGSFQVVCRFRLSGRPREA
jgi:hypothetical protein